MLTYTIHIWCHTDQKNDLPFALPALLIINKILKASRRTRCTYSDRRWSKACWNGVRFDELLNGCLQWQAHWTESACACPRWWWVSHALLWPRLALASPWSTRGFVSSPPMPNRLRMSARHSLLACVHPLLVVAGGAPRSQPIFEDDVQNPFTSKTNYPSSVFQIFFQHLLNKSRDTDYWCRRQKIFVRIENIQ